MQLPSMLLLEETTKIRREIDNLEDRLAAMFAPSPLPPVAVEERPRSSRRKRKSRRMTPELREHLSKLAKKRWATAHRAGRKNL